MEQIFKACPGDEFPVVDELNKNDKVELVRCGEYCQIKSPIEFGGFVQIIMLQT